MFSMMPRVLELLNLVINGVVNPGNVEVKELPVSSFQDTLGYPFTVEL